MAEKSKVTRIKATDDAPKEKSVKPAVKKTSVKKPALKVSRSASKSTKKVKNQEKPLSKNGFIRFLQRFGRYFKGSWDELKEVRWPTRKATWGLTVAVLIFSGFFAGVIVLLDLGFNALFELIITE